MLESLTWTVSRDSDTPGGERSGHTLYGLALLSGHARMAQLLLEHRVKQTTLHGLDAFAAGCMLAPLHQAAWAGHLEVARLLIELGADPRLRGQDHASTPLEGARFNRQTAVVSFLESSET